MPAKKKANLPVIPEKAVVPPVESALPTPMPERPMPPVPPVPNIPPQTMAPGDERTWGMLAHLSTLLNLATGFGGPIAALVIYMVYKDRSRFVAYHALQAMVFQLIWWFGGGAIIGLMWAIVGMLSAILIGIVLIPVAAVITPILALLPVGALIYGIVGAVQVSQGQDFKYWLVGDWVRGTLTGA
jgi:uncharacterized Tic20 family protein